MSGAAPQATIVCAVRDAADNVGAILEAFGGQGADEVEVIFCVAGVVPPALDPPPPRVKVFAAPADALVPHLWAKGIKAAASNRVAITTAHCVPDAGWLDEVRKADVDRWAGIGGVFDNDRHATGVNWAVFFLRYIRFAEPVTTEPVNDIAADNAVYNRDLIVGHPDLLEEGFWEPSFHRRFAQAGWKLRLEPALRVTHRGLNTAGEFTELRFHHGTEYGRSRAGAATTGRRLLLLAAAPAIPLVILGRIIRNVGQRPRYWAPLLKAMPWLLLFVGAWTCGEARGYAAVAFQPRAGR